LRAGGWRIDTLEGEEADSAFLVRNSSEDLQVVRSEGSYRFDDRGRRRPQIVGGRAARMADGTT